DSLFDVHIFRMRYVLITYILTNSNRVDDQCSTVPVSNRIAIESRLNIIHSLLLTIEQNSANLSVGLLNDRDLPPALQNLHRKWAGHHSRHSIRKTHDHTLGDGLSFGTGFTRRLGLSLPLLQVLWL